MLAISLASELGGILACTHCLGLVFRCCLKILEIASRYNFEFDSYNSLRVIGLENKMDLVVIGIGLLDVLFNL